MFRSEFQNNGTRTLVMAKVDHCIFCSFSIKEWMKSVRLAKSGLLSSSRIATISSVRLLLARQCAYQKGYPCDEHEGFEPTRVSIDRGEFQKKEAHEE
jgi:hypothetical protein